MKACRTAAEPSSNTGTIADGAGKKDCFHDAINTTFALSFCATAESRSRLDVVKSIPQVLVSERVVEQAVDVPFSARHGGG